MFSNASASSNSFLNESGAGSHSEAGATSPTRQPSTSSAEIFAPQGTSSGGSASASGSEDPLPETSAIVEASGLTINLSQNVSSTEPLNNLINQTPVVSDPLESTSNSLSELFNFNMGTGSNETPVVSDPVESTSSNNSSQSSNSSGELVNSTGTGSNETPVVSEPIASNSNQNSSPASGSSSSLVNSTGAGSTSEANATSPTGQTSSNGASTFDSAATSSSGSSSAGASTQSPPVTEAAASAPATTETNPTPEPPLNVMVASPSDNPMIVGTVSSDLIIGSTDNNSLFGNAGEDLLFGEGGDDSINGGQGDDNVNGGDSNDTLRGGKGNDWLNGGNGDDYLIGDFGVDTLIGGNGGDTFGLRTETVHPAADPRLADAIVDFNSAEGDRIALMGEVSLAGIVLQTIDFNGDGQINDAINPTTGADATLIKLGPNPEDGILAVVLGTVDAKGATILNIADFIV
jgi:serralysin